MENRIKGYFPATAVVSSDIREDIEKRAPVSVATDFFILGFAIFSDALLWPFHALGYEMEREQEGK